MGINEEYYKEKRITLLKAIKDRAKKYGITHEEIAEKTGFTRNNVSRMLSGRYAPTLDNLFRLAEAVNGREDMFIMNYLSYIHITSTPEEKNIMNIAEQKFLISVDPLKKELFILHRENPKCLIQIIPEVPVKFVIQDWYEIEVPPVKEIMAMPFVEQAKAFFEVYGEHFMNSN